MHECVMSDSEILPCLETRHCTPRSNGSIPSLVRVALNVNSVHITSLICTFSKVKETT